MLWRRMRYKSVEWHIITQWGFAKGYCVTNGPHKPFWQGGLHNII